MKSRLEQTISLQDVSNKHHLYKELDRFDIVIKRKEGKFYDVVINKDEGYKLEMYLFRSKGIFLILVSNSEPVYQSLLSELIELPENLYRENHRKWDGYFSEYLLENYRII